MVHFISNLSFRITAELKTSTLEHETLKFQRKFSTYNNVLYILIFVAFNALCQFIVSIMLVLNLSVVILCCG